MSMAGNILISKRLERQNEILASIAYSMGATPMPTSWAETKQAVRSGEHTKIFSVGDRILTTFGGQPRVVNVIGINHDIPSDPSFENSLTIQFEDYLMSAQFSAEQALYYAEEELPAGEHVFTRDDTGERYKIVTAQAIPVGGQIFIPTWGADPYPPLVARTYATDRTSVIEDNIDIVPTEDPDTLGEVNVRRRMMYGSNNYLESAIRQWLNSSDEVFKWEPQTFFDRPSSYSGDGGFLYRLDPELAAVIGPVDKHVARNTVTDGGGQDTFSDKVFLLSRTEVYGGTEGDSEGESPYPFYEAMAESPTTSAIEGRIKYLGSSARAWWLRSPHVGHADRVRIVDSDGRITNRYARHAHGAAPACCIW